MNARNSVKLLRRVGIALVAMPEPVTTPVGIACIIAARYLSKTLEADLYKRLQGTLQHYLAISSRPEKEGEEKPAKVKRARRSSEPKAEKLIPGQEAEKTSRLQKVKDAVQQERAAAIQENRVPTKPKQAPMVMQSGRQAPAKLSHHELDSKRLTNRPAATARDEDDSAKKAVRHNIDRKSIARRYGIESSPPVPVSRDDKEGENKNLIRHGIDKNKLASRYGISKPAAETGRKAVAEDLNVIRHKVDRQKLAEHYGIKGKQSPAAKDEETVNKNLIHHDRQKLTSLFNAERADKAEEDDDGKRVHHRRGLNPKQKNTIGETSETSNVERHRIDTAALRKRYDLPDPGRVVTRKAPSKARAAKLNQAP